MSKLILFQGGVETLTFFSKQMEPFFREQGFDIFWYDLEQQSRSAKYLRKFIKPGETILLTFNFLGLTQEEGLYDEDYGYIWEQYDIPCFNIVVDHPLYYSERYEQVPKRYYQISIDYEHERFLKQYYSEIHTLGFCPLAGTSLYRDEEFPSYEEWMSLRAKDVLFVGNYNDPNQYESYITRVNEEYTAFYRGMISELLHHPEKSLSEVVRRHCIREMGQISNREWQLVFQHMNFIDLYLRFTVRQNVLKAILDSGITVDIYGSGYENFKTEHPECMRLHGQVDSLTCLEQMQRAKISLNVMPWFREGAHDRIFNAMANGSVSVSDSSSYLQTRFEDGKNVIFYDLNQLDSLTTRLKQLLGRPEELYRIAKNASPIVCQEHTWNNRAHQIYESMKKVLAES